MSRLSLGKVVSSGLKIRGAGGLEVVMAGLDVAGCTVGLEAAKREDKQKSFNSSWDSDSPRTRCTDVIWDWNQTRQTEGGGYITQVGPSQWELLLTDDLLSVPTGRLERIMMERCNTDLLTGHRTLAAWPRLKTGSRFHHRCQEGKFLCLSKQVCNHLRQGSACTISGAHPVTVKWTFEHTFNTPIQELNAPTSTVFYTSVCIETWYVCLDHVKCSQRAELQPEVRGQSTGP